MLFAHPSGVPEKTSKTNAQRTAVIKWIAER